MRNTYINSKYSMHGSIVIRGEITNGSFLFSFESSQFPYLSDANMNVKIFICMYT